MQALKEVIELCAAEQGRREVLQVPLSLVRLMGSADGGLFVAQLLAWSDKEGPWVLRSDADWAAATALPPARVRALTRQCLAMGFLESGAGPAGARGTRRYRVLSGPLFRVLTAFLRNERAGRKAAPPAVRRVPARRRVRLPVQAEPARWPEAPASPPAERAAASLPALPEVRVVEALPAGCQAAGTRANGNGPALNAPQPARVSPPRVRPAPSSGLFDAQRWELALAELSRKLSRDAYTRWLAGSRFAAVEGGTVIVAVDDLNTAWWLNTRLSRVVERAVNLVAPGKEWLAVEARLAS